MPPAPMAPCTMLIFCVFVLLSGFTLPAIADKGDSLIVAGTLVNIRNGPSLEDPVIKRLAGGDEVIEISRYGNWVEVALAGGGDDYGWIHASLLEDPAGTGPADQDNARITNFRNILKKHLDANGYKEKSPYFTDLIPLENHGLQLVAGEAWFRLPMERQQSLVAEIFAIWRDEVGTGISVLVEVVDQNKEQHMIMYN